MGQKSPKSPKNGPFRYLLKIVILLFSANAFKWKSSMLANFWWKPHVCEKSASWDMGQNGGDPPLACTYNLTHATLLHWHLYFFFWYFFRFFFISLISALGQLPPLTPYAHTRTCTHLSPRQNFFDFFQLFLFFELFYFFYFFFILGLGKRLLAPPSP